MTIAHNQVLVYQLKGPDYPLIWLNCDKSLLTKIMIDENKKKVKLLYALFTFQMFYE